MLAVETMNAECLPGEATGVINTKPKRVRQPHVQVIKSSAQVPEADEIKEVLESFLEAQRSVATNVADTSRDFDMTIPLPQRFDAVFSEESHKYKHIIEKIRNDALGNDSAWYEAEVLLRYLDPVRWDLIKENPQVTRMLFNAGRDAFFILGIEKFKKNANTEEVITRYRREKRQIMSSLSDAEFELNLTFADIFERGLFRGILSPK